MESLYRKYRPQTFDDVVGQRPVVSTLEHAVLEGRTSHAYLFCGPRGTGKTTMARLLAKALLCEEGPGKLPDGTCDQCRAIAAGEHPDVYELDAASRTGVDNVREEIINRVDYAPVQGRYKVYIVDEVHMLTTAAFNALLKTLEEPPSHVVFVLCTTDPQKVPATILSRVQRFDFHSISNEDIEGRLVHVCEQEGFAYDEAALELVCRHARGGLRDALSTLEQLSVFGDGEVSLEAAQDLLGEVAVSTLASVTRALAGRDVPTLFGEVAGLVDAGRDLLQFARELAAHVRDVYVVSVAGAADGVVAATDDELAQLGREAEAFGSADRVARTLTILGDASNEMRVATNQRLVLEVAFARVARPEADLTLEALADRMSTLEGQVAALSTPGVVPAPQPAPASAEPRLAETTAPVEPRSAPVPAPVPVPAGCASADAGALQRRWKQVVDGLLASQPSHGSLLMSSSIVSDDGASLTVSLPKGSSFASRMLGREDVRRSVDPAVAEVFGPRRLVYVESSLAATAISRAGRAASASVPPSVPAPEPVAPSPVPPGRAGVGMGPGPDSDSADEVPYDDADAAAYEEDAPTSAPVPPAPSADVPMPMDAMPDDWPAASSVPAGVTAGASPAGDAVGDAPVAEVPQALASMLEGVFGEGVTVSTLGGPAHGGPDVAGEAPSADEGADAYGFADEGVDDADDDGDDDDTMA